MNKANNNVDDVRTMIINYLADQLQINVSDIQFDDPLRKFEDFGLNSIYFVKILLGIEENV